MTSTSRWASPTLLCLGAAMLALTPSRAQVFVVGERSATAEIKTDFTPTSVPLPDGHLSERGRRELLRDLEAEQGFAHRALPMGAGLTLEANGPLTPGADKYKQMIYQKGQSSAPGDRVVVTAMLFKGDRIVIDLNGGPYAKHRFLSHVSFDDNPVTQPQDQATGSRVTLIFKNGIPEISAPEVKALLTPVIDFGAKTSSDAFADTLPGPIKEAVMTHEVLVGMDRRMVLASVGPPASKVREHADNSPDGSHYEEWIYGQVPQTVRFVRFNGDRVVQVKIAALGKAIEIHNQDEMGDYAPASATREIAMGDAGHGPDHAAGPPTLRKPGEVLPVTPENTTQKVQYPPPAKPIPTVAPGDSQPTQSAPPSAKFVGLLP